MRAANRKLNKATTHHCIHIAYDKDLIFYCDANQLFGPGCSEGCQYYETPKPVHYTNRECKVSLHVAQRLAKIFKKRKSS